MKSLYVVLMVMIYYVNIDECVSKNNQDAQSSLTKPSGELINQIRSSVVNNNNKDNILNENDSESDNEVNISNNIIHNNERVVHTIPNDITKSVKLNSNVESLNNQNFKSDRNISITKKSIPDFLGVGTGNKVNSVHIPNAISVMTHTPSLKIKSIDTHILIRKDKTEGEVSESVRFTLKDGTFDTIIRKVSLGGTSDRFFGFKLLSS